MANGVYANAPLLGHFQHTKISTIVYIGGIKRREITRISNRQCSIINFISANFHDNRRTSMIEEIGIGRLTTFNICISILSKSAEECAPRSRDVLLAVVQ